jgi:DNA-binding SARP family transcriptional activator/predicted ATPase
MARLSIRLLGSLHVTLDGEPVTAFESDKVRALLAYLVSETDQPHRRERLAGLLWPDLPERSARTNLRVALSNLRKVIGDSSSSPVLCVSRQTIQLDSDADAWIDIQAFADLLTALGRPKKVVAYLRQAVELYRSGFLQGFSLPDSAEFEEWALLQQELFQRQVVSALRRLARWHERRGEYQQALPRARRLVALEPWQEAGQRQLMRLLALTGQRSAALAQYETFRRMLAEELGVEPEDETTALYERIRAGQAPGESTLAPPDSNLPIPATPFVGREPELDAIYRRLQDPGCRLLTLVGPGGSGKTRLALEAAADSLSDTLLFGDRATFHPADGVFFVSLAPLGSAEAIVPALAEALGFSFRGKGDPWQQLLDYLQRKEMLLVMDNFEHLLDGADLISQILRTAPQVKILATSRARLNIQAEHIFSVEGMALPDQAMPDTAWSTDAFLGYDGIELFVNGARRAHPDFSLTSENAADVVHICRLVDGLPLAVLLAAAWVERMAPAELVARLSGAMEQSLDLLDSEWRDIPDRQRSIRAVFEHSWNLLTARQQQVLQALSVFRGGFTRRAAKEVTGALERELAALVHRSLLSHTPGGRYGMHELLRQFLSEKLDRSPQIRESYHDRHSAYYTASLAGWGADLKGKRQQAALAELGVDGENARAAWDWAVDRGQVERLAQALEGLCLFYEWQVQYRRGASACQLAAKRLEPLVPSSTDTLRLLARLLTWQSVFVQRFEGTEVAGQLLEQGLTLLDGPHLSGQDTCSERAHILWRLGRLAAGADREKARQWYEQSLALYRTAGDRWGTANVLASLGGVAWNLGDHQEAKRWHTESLALRQSLGDARGIAKSLTAVGETALHLGQLEEAERLVRRGCTLRQEIGDRRGIADGCRHLGTTLLALGKLAEATELLEKCVTIYTDLGFRFGLEVAMLGDTRIHLGDYGAGRAYGQRGLEIARETGYQRGIGYSLYVLGAVALARGKYEEAETFLQESVTIYWELGQRDEGCRALAALECTAPGLGRRSGARPDFCDELRKAVQGQAFLPLLWGLPALALLLASKSERAVELYALALRYSLIANSRWFEDVVGCHIAAVAESLSPEAVAAAKERARARDLEATVKELLIELEG